MKKRKVKQHSIFLTVVIFIIIASLTACGKFQNKIDETTTAASTTAKATTAEDTTTAEADTTETTEIITTQPSTTVKITVKAPTTAPTTQKETTTKKAVSEEYERLLSKLKKKLSEKSFDYEVNMLFLDTFDYLYKYLPGWISGYSDFPGVEKYIENNLINVLDKIDAVNFYDANSDEAENLWNEGLPDGWVELDENKRQIISIISEPYDTENKNKRSNDIEKFFHEITHCREVKETFESELFEEMNLYLILTEGGATFHMKFTTSRDERDGGSWLIADDEDLLNISYNKSNCTGYLVDMNAYEKLVYLAGYDMVEKVVVGEIPFSSIENKISEKYGEENATEFFKTMNDWYTEYNNAWKADSTYEMALKLENLFLNFIRQDIELLKTKNEAEKFKPKYDFYITKNLPKAFDCSFEPRKDLTRETFNIDTLDKMLEEKLL